MPNCPDCKKEIDHLILVEIVAQEWIAKYNKEELHELELVETRNSTCEETRGYECPECTEKLFDEPEEASDFLNPNVCIRENCDKKTDEPKSVCLRCEKIEHDAWQERETEIAQAKEERDNDLNRGISKYD